MSIFAFHFFHLLMEFLGCLGSWIGVYFCHFIKYIFKFLWTKDIPLIETVPLPLWRLLCVMDGLFLSSHNVLILLLGGFKHFRGTIALVARRLISHCALCLSL